MKYNYTMDGPVHNHTEIQHPYTKYTQIQQPYTKYTHKNLINFKSKDRLTATWMDWRIREENDEMNETHKLYKVAW